MEYIRCTYLREYVLAQSDPISHQQQMDQYWKRATSHWPCEPRRWTDLVYHNAFHWLAYNLGLYNVKGMGPNRMYGLAYLASHYQYEQELIGSQLFGASPSGQWRQIAGLAMVPWILINDPESFMRGFNVNLNNGHRYRVLTKPFLVTARTHLSQSLY